MKITKNDISRNNRDETIGRALAETIVEQEAPGFCLTDEDIAVIIDGTLSEPERDLFMKHVSSCETCFNIFSSSQRLMETRTLPSQKNRFVLPSVGLAIAALLAIILKISLQGNTPDKPVSVAENKPSVTNIQKQVTIPLQAVAPALPSGGVATVYSPLSAADAARLLSHESDVKLLMAAVSSDKSEVYGFSGAVPRENRAFRLGIQSVDLELSLRANEREVVVSHLKQIVELMPIAHQEQSATTGLDRVIRQVDKGFPLKNYRNCTASIEKTLVTKDEQFLYIFGVWAEGGRLAASVGNRDYFDPRSLDYVKGGIKDMQLPPGLLKALQDVEGIIEKGVFAENDFLVIKRAFEDVTAIF